MELLVKNKVLALSVFFLSIAGISTGLLADEKANSDLVTKEIDKTLSVIQDEPRFGQDTVKIVEHDLNKALHTNSEILRTARFSLNEKNMTSMDADALSAILRRTVLAELNDKDVQSNRLEISDFVNPKLVEPNGIINTAYRKIIKSFSKTKSTTTGGYSAEELSTANQLVVDNDSAQLPIPYSFTGNEQNYVLRYVCCSGLPIIYDHSLSSNQLFNESNIVAIPEANEVVAVFDDLPVYNGDQLFVRVQRSGGQHYTGWFPLFWLHEISSPKVGAEIHTGVSYQGISKQIRDTAQTIFYKNCHTMPPEGGEPIFPLQGPSGKDYECGEYPVGNTNYNYNLDGRPFRYLTTARKVINSHNEEAGPFSYGYRGIGMGNNALVMDFPVGIGSLSAQTRRDNDFTAQELGDDNFQFLTRSYWQSESAQEEGNVRIHAMDWYFKTWFDSDAPTNANEVNFSLRVNMPGFDIYSDWADQQIVVWFRDHEHVLSQANIQQIKLGGMRIKDIPLRIDGKVVLNINAAGTEIGETFVSNTQNKVSVEFTNIQATTEPEITIYDDVDILYQPQGNVEYINYAMSYFEFVLNGVLSNDGFGSYLWEVASENVMSSLLDALQELEPRLVQLFDSPRSLAIDACDAAMPMNYKTMQSPFYAFYRNCTDFAATINSQNFLNQSNSLIQIPYGFTENPSYWANVNLAGLPWRNPDHDEQDFPCVGEANCTTVIERPWWSLYNPYYAYSGGPKFDPSSYNYVSSKGGKVRYQAHGEATKHYWHFLQCLIPSVDQKLNANPQEYLTDAAALTPEECRFPALETVCALYGEGEDLEAQWEARWGNVPSLSGYAQYCAWAEELRNEQEGEGVYGLQIE